MDLFFIELDFLSPLLSIDPVDSKYYHELNTYDKLGSHKRPGPKMTVLFLKFKIDLIQE